MRLFLFYVGRHRRSDKNTIIFLPISIAPSSDVTSIAVSSTTRTKQIHTSTFY